MAIEHVDRDVLARDAAEWLLIWQQEGWIPTASLTDVGMTAAGDRVTRVRLAVAPRAERPASPCPGAPELPARRPEGALDGRQTTRLHGRSPATRAPRTALFHGLQPHESLYDAAEWPAHSHPHGSAIKIASLHSSGSKEPTEPLAVCRVELAHRRAGTARGRRGPRLSKLHPLTFARLGSCTSRRQLRGGPTRRALRLDQHAPTCARHGGAIAQSASKSPEVARPE
jgi:hypothetical protein